MARRRLRTAELAAAAGVTPTAVRYYERRGLLPDPGRTESGYRSYPPEAVDRVRFIKRAQSAGFTLREIRLLLAARVSRNACRDMCALAERKALQLEAEVKRANARRRLLERLLAERDPRGRAAHDCPVARHLEARDAARRRRRRA